MDPITVVTLGVFFAGLIFQAGRLSVRVEKLEAFQAGTLDELRSINALLGKLAGVAGRRP